MAKKKTLSECFFERENKKLKYYKKIWLKILTPTAQKIAKNLGISGKIKLVYKDLIIDPLKDSKNNPCKSVKSVAKNEK